MTPGALPGAGVVGGIGGALYLPGPRIPPSHVSKVSFSVVGAVFLVGLESGVDASPEIVSLSHPAELAALIPLADAPRFDRILELAAHGEPA